MPVLALRREDDPCGPARARRSIRHNLEAPRGWFVEVIYGDGSAPVVIPIDSEVWSAGSLFATCAPEENLNERKREGRYGPRSFGDEVGSVPYRYASQRQSYKHALQIVPTLKSANEAVTRLSSPSPE